MNETKPILNKCPECHRVYYQGKWRKQDQIKIPVLFKDCLCEDCVEEDDPPEAQGSDLDIDPLVVGISSAFNSLAEEIQPFQEEVSRQIETITDSPSCAPEPAPIELEAPEPSYDSSSDSSCDCGSSDSGGSSDC